jgi:hypothetical protein
MTFSRTGGKLDSASKTVLLPRGLICPTHCANTQETNMRAINDALGDLERNLLDPGERVHQLTQAYAREHAVPYLAALNAVVKTNPELARKYALRPVDSARDVHSPADRLDAYAKEIQTQRKCPYHEALIEARGKHPKLALQYLLERMSNRSPLANQG